MSEKEKKYFKMLPNVYFYIKKVKEIGIQPKYMGFYYIVEIMDLLINQNMSVRSFSKQIYPMLAKKYNKKENTIERNIRSVVNKFWHSKLKKELMQMWLRDSIPSCCEFLYILKNYIVMQFS